MPDKEEIRQHYLWLKNKKDKLEEDKSIEFHTWCSNKDHQSKSTNICRYTLPGLVPAF